MYFYLKYNAGDFYKEVKKNFKNLRSCEEPKKIYLEVMGRCVFTLFLYIFQKKFCRKSLVTIEKFLSLLSSILNVEIWQPYIKRPVCVACRCRLSRSRVPK